MNDMNEINLFLCIARVPNTNRIGVIQYIAKHLKLDLKVIGKILQQMNYLKIKL